MITFDLTQYHFLDAPAYLYSNITLRQAHNVDEWSLLCIDG